MNRHERRALIAQRIADSGPDGISRVKLTDGMEGWEFARVLKDRREDGEPLYVHRNATGETPGATYFSTAEFHRAYALKCIAAKRARKAERDQGRSAEWYRANKDKILARLREKRKTEPPRVRAKPNKAQKPIKEKPLPKAKPVRVADTRPVDYGDVKPIKIKTPKPRFHVEIGPDFVSALDPQQCRPWALAAVRATVPVGPQPGDYLIG